MIQRGIGVFIGAIVSLILLILMTSVAWDEAVTPLAIQRLIFVWELTSNIAARLVRCSAIQPGRKRPTFDGSTVGDPIMMPMTSCAPSGNVSLIVAFIPAWLSPFAADGNCHCRQRERTSSLTTK